MKVINKLFWKGLVVVTPITLSVYLLLIMLNKAEGIFGKIIKSLIGPSNYIPGLGIFLTIILMIIVGLLVSNLITGSVIKFFINQFEKFPIIKTIYNPLKDLMSLFGGNNTDKMKKVVMVDFPKMGLKSLGLVTREEFDDLGNCGISNDEIAVYIPMGYMIGGFTVIVPRESLTELDLPVETALKLAITGWVKADKNVF